MGRSEGFPTKAVSADLLSKVLSPKKDPAISGQALSAGHRRELNEKQYNGPDQGLTVSIMSKNCSAQVETVNRVFAVTCGSWRMQMRNVQ